MNDENNNFENRPRLKKIKRPIRRETIENPAFINDEEIKDFDDLSNIDLDSTLDIEENATPALPAISDAEAEDQTDETPVFLDEKDVYTPAPEMPMWLNIKSLILFVFVAFLIGFFTSSMLSKPATVVRGGLQGVVPNNEVPRGRARCGLTDRTQGCVLYLMNPQRQELNGRDFYDLVSQLTGRQRFVIETANMRYSNTKIRPGEFGQFNVPPL